MHVSDTHTHSHEHVHADGTVHTHEHTHDGAHSHHHGHAEHTNGAIDAKTMLGYQVEHNRQHATELRALANAIGGVTGNMVLEAAALFEAGSDKLAEALTAMED